MHDIVGICVFYDATRVAACVGMTIKSSRRSYEPSRADDSVSTQLTLTRCSTEDAVAKSSAAKT